MDTIEELADRLPSGMVSTHHGELAAHAHDRWALALLREAAGARVPPPAAIAYPISTDHVAVILKWARETGTALVARGGGSGLVGGAEAVKRSVVLELSRLDRIVALDMVSQTISAQAGARGAAIEAALVPHGFTLGLDPVSLQISTIGGWIASGATGVGTTGFGGIRELLLGLTVVTGEGEVVSLGAVPRSATGPDLRRLFVGSEGGFGIVTEATLSASRLPSALRWSAFTPNSFEGGIALVREIVQRPFRPLVIRLHDAAEAAASFAAFGFLDLPVLFVGLDREAPGGEAERFELDALARRFGARQADPEAAEQWWDHRFEGHRSDHEAPGSEGGQGTVTDLADFGAVWRKIPRIYEEVRGALLDRAESVTCRLVDPSPAGAALMFTFTLRSGQDPEAEDTYLQAWDAAARAALDAGATLSHSHGIGLLKAPYLERELGRGGLGVLRRLKDALDPGGILNPGKVMPEHRRSPVAPQDPL